QSRQADSLCSDPTGNVDYRLYSGAPEFLDDAVKRGCLPRDAGIPVAVDQVIEGRDLIIKVLYLGHLSLVIGHLSLVICHLSLVICHSSLISRRSQLIGATHQWQMANDK